MMDAITVYSANSGVTVSKLLGPAFTFVRQGLQHSDFGVVDR